MLSLVENEDPEELPSFLTESESHLSSHTVLRLTKEQRMTCYSPFFFYHLFCFHTFLISGIGLKDLHMLLKAPTTEPHTVCIYFYFYKHVSHSS